jgi:hypothetical protein
MSNDERVPPLVKLKVTKRVKFNTTWLLLEKFTAIIHNSIIGTTSFIPVSYNTERTPDTQLFNFGL